jgi:hypothetical protein
VRTQLCLLSYIPHVTKKVTAVIGLGLLLLLLLVPSRWGLKDGPDLTMTANSVTQGIPRIQEGDTVTIGSMFSCLDEPGSVTVTDISAVGATGLTVTGWAIRPNPYWKRPQSIRPGDDASMIGAARRTLTKLQFPTSPVVDVECGKNGEGFEFAVEVLKTTDGAAGASGWVITYTSDGDTKQIEFPLATRLCKEDKAWAKACQALKV